MVAAGILLSRIIGLVRNRVFAHFFGTSDAYGIRKSMYDAFSGWPFSS